MYLLLRYAADGNRREGEWVDDLLHGFVTFTCKSCRNNNNVSNHEDIQQSENLDVTKIERWRRGRRISDGVSERSPIVNFFNK